MALVNLGRAREALALAEELFEAAPGERGGLAVAYARLAQRTGAPEPARLVSRLEAKDIPLRRAQAGLPREGDGEPSEVEQVLRAAPSDPAGALEALARVPAFALPWLDAETRYLLHAEAVRAGHPMAAALDDLSHMEPDHLRAFHAYVRGEAAAARRPASTWPSAPRPSWSAPGPRRSPPPSGTGSARRRCATTCSGRWSGAR